jgi:hypothetical protein
LSDYYSGSYLITVGQGGETNSKGGDTIGFGQTAYGGGSGAYTFRRTNTGGSGTIDLGSINATSGGSGGGGGMYSPDSLGNFESHKFGGNGVVTQGYAGGNGGYSYSGGGGGAGGLGNVILSEYPIGGGPGKTVFDGITYSPGGNGGLAFVNTSSDVSIKGAGGHGGGTPNLAGRRGANGLAIVAVVDPSALPNAPTNVSASISSTTFTSATATISYNTSTVSGASAITGYYAISSPGNLVGYVSGTGGGNITVANLSLVTNYTFQVKAQNGYGNSLSSASSNSILGASVPSAPIIGTAYLLSNSSANVSYTASVNNGGYAITSYTAVSTPGNITATLSTSGSGNITVNGLSNSTTYSFVVYATSSYGNSNVSASSNSIATPGVPLAPSITRVTLANTSAVVISYNAASSGGNTITSFTAISTPGNIISTVNQSGSGTITMTGLSADSYTFKVYATNYYGNSSLSISSNTVPVGANVQYDQYYDNTALLITADTSSNAWVIDQSISPSSNVALTTGASLSTADSIFNGKSFYLDGQTYYSTAKISYASNSKFYIPGDFTLETYIKYTNTTSQGQFIFDILPVGYIYIHGPTGQIRLQLDKDGSGLPDIGGANYYVNMGTMSANAWHHIALCRSGTNVRVFVDGNQLGSTQTLSGNITAANGLTLGGNDFVGYIDQIRLTPGIARYIGTFTSPDALGKNTIYYT